MLSSLRRLEVKAWGIQLTGAFEAQGHGVLEGVSPTKTDGTSKASIEQQVFTNG